MGKIVKLVPVALLKLILFDGHGCLRRQRAVTRKYAGAKKIVGGHVRGKLTISKDISFADPLLKGRHQRIDVDDLNHPFELGTRHQPQLYPGYNAEKAISAYHQPKK